MNYKPLFLILFLAFSGSLLFAQGTIINANTHVTIAAGTTLDLSLSDLVLKSDATGDASLIDNGSITYSGGGMAIVERYLTQGKWHLISSPISDATTGMFIDDYLQNHAENTNGWSDISQSNTNLGVMQGFALWTIDASPTTEFFHGSTNTGLQNRAFTQNNLGWNIMGNPYPSAIDWDAVTIPPELNGAIWLFDPTIGANGDYRYYINGGGAANTASQYIPSGQGFFVRATGGAGTLSLDNSDRVHNGQAFYKSEQSELLVLKVNGNNISTQTAIRFNEQATQQVDRLFDVYRIISDSPEVPMLFTKAETQNMAINTLPSIEGNDIVPMWFRAGTSGEYSIKASEIETFDSQTPIYIEDLETGTIQNLREMPDYSFNYKSGNDRGFLIYFIEPGTSNRTSEINIFANASILHVNFPTSEMANPDFNAQIMVFDITGRLILQQRTTQINNLIPLKGSNIIYMVNVNSADEVANAKVFVQ